MLHKRNGRPMLKRNLIIASLLAGSVLPGLALAQDVSKPAEPAKAAEEPKPPYTLTANVYLVSDYFFRGITQTWDKPAIQGGADFVHDSGAYLGTWASNVSGNQYAGGSLEWDFYGGYNYKINDDFTVGAGLYYYYYPGANNDQAAARWCRVRLTTPSKATCSPAGSLSPSSSTTPSATTSAPAQATGFTDNTNGTYYLQLDAAYPLPSVEGLSLIGHVGYTHYSAQLACGQRQRRDRSELLRT